jgi:hypothetical protein
VRIASAPRASLLCCFHLITSKAFATPRSRPIGGTVNDSARARHAVEPPTIEVECIDGAELLHGCGEFVKSEAGGIEFLTAIGDQII